MSENWEASVGRGRSRAVHCVTLPVFPAAVALTAEYHRDTRAIEGGQMAKRRKSNARKNANAGRAPDGQAAPDRRESGEPGGGQGRRDDVGGSGVYPPDAENRPDNAEVRMAGSWGGGDYNESGGSELVYRDGQLLGGLTAGPDGAPTEDTHSNPTLPSLPRMTDTGDEEK